MLSRAATASILATDDSELLLANPVKGRPVRRAEVRKDRGVVVCDRINLINAVILVVAHVLLAFVTREEAPTAVSGTLRRLSVHVADAGPVNENAISGQTPPGALNERRDLFWPESEALRLRHGAV